MTKSHLRKLAAESLGACALVFSGTGAIITNNVSGGAGTWTIRFLMGLSHRAIYGRVTCRRDLPSHRRKV